QEYQRQNIPREIVLNHMPDESETLSEALTLFAAHKVDIKTRVRGHRQQWLNLASTNAEHGLMSKLNSKQSMENRFALLHKALNTEKLPIRLECFDISHSSGEATVASC